MKELDSDSSVHGNGNGENKSSNKKTPSENEEKIHPSKKFNCRNCGTRRCARECPAYGKTCNYCQKKKITSRVCADHGNKSMDWA